MKFYLYWKPINSFKCSNYNISRNITISKNSFIWVYDIKDLSLINNTPFKTKSECAKNLNISRTTVTVYLDANKLFKNKWIFSSFALSHETLSSYVIPCKVWQVITGELLGDGHINYNPKLPNINGRLEFTFSSKILHYVNYLEFDVLSFICTKSKPTPWHNKNLTNKEPTQYWFYTKRISALSDLHKIWYKEIGKKFVKTILSNIEQLLTPIGLAHWIMGDGYFYNGSVIICTDNFTLDEVLILKAILEKKFLLKVSLKKCQNTNNVVWRVSISKLSLENLKLLVIPYFIPEMLYKLNGLGREP